MTKILLIDTDSKALDTMRTALENNEFTVFMANTGQTGLKIAWQESPDLVILDLIMPVMDGFETCRRLRELGVPSILVKSPNNDEKSVVKALEMGADDFLHKPINTSVLLAKIHTMLRRHNQNTANNFLKYEDGQLSIDLDNRYVEIHGKPVKLTPTEFRLLTILMRRVGRVVSHEELIQEIWGTDKNVGLGSLKLYIHYLRQKIEDHPRRPRYLLAEWGVGYRLREPEQEMVS
jgi:DNA-binding response OmpR family regulator